jgi:ubiquinone/menaquinone biosynthesis C-methylase UbiE
MISPRNDGARKDNVIASHYRIGAYFYDIIVHGLQVFIGGATTWRNSFVRFIHPRRNETLLELCCGTGAVALTLSKRIGGPVWASDLSIDQIRVACFKARLLRRNVNFSVRDASSTGYPSSFFDAVIISGALHEITPQRRLIIYREIRRVLRPHGRLFITEPDLPANRWGAVCFEFMFGQWSQEHETAYQLVHGGLEAELAAAGYHLETTSSSNFGVFKHRRFVVSS